MWEGQGVITYGRKLIGATDPQKSEPGTIRGDLAVVVGRYYFADKMLVSHSLYMCIVWSSQSYYCLCLQKYHPW